MKNLSLLFLSITLYHTSVSQLNVQQVIDTENSFATYAVQHNTKEAFLQFLDSNAVVFNNGKVNNAKKIWTNNLANSSKLLWKPAFAGISGSGDLGFTTGPWEFKQDLNDTSIASGQFATIWHKTANGEWKFLVDIGVSFTPSMYNKIKTVKIAGNATPSVLKTNLDVLQIEDKFIREYRNKGNEAFTDAADPQIMIIIQGSHPFLGKKQLKEALLKMPRQMEFIPMEGRISGSGDIAYAYGTIKYNSKEENYLRIWQYNKNGWKIVLQVIK